MNRAQFRTLALWLGAVALIVAFPPWANSNVDYADGVRWAPFTSPEYSPTGHAISLTAYARLHWPILIMELIGVTVAAFGAIWVFRYSSTQCRRCGYDLRGTIVAGNKICPECGAVIKKQMLRRMLRALPNGKPDISESLPHRWGSTVWRVAWIAGILFLFSLALYNRSSPGWGGATFEVQARQTAIGQPLHWLRYTKHTVTGSPPQFDTMPDAWLYPPGVHVDFFALIVAILSCVIIASVLVAMRYIWQTHLHAFRSPIAAYFMIAIVAAAIGLIDPTQLGWVGILLVFVGLPAVIVTATWSVNTYGSATLGTAIALVSLWWALRFADHFRSEHLFRDVDTEEVVALPMFFAIYIILVLPAVMLHRLMAARRSS